VVIVIESHSDRLYRIQVLRKTEIPNIFPFIDDVLLPVHMLADFVRLLAI